MKIENAMAVRTAIEKERADCMAKLDNELRLAKEVVEEKNREIEMYRIRTTALIEQGKRYKNMIDRLIGEFELNSEIQQTLMEKVLYHILGIVSHSFIFNSLFAISDDLKKNLLDHFVYFFQIYYILILLYLLFLYIDEKS